MNITKLLFSLNSVGECSSVQSSQKVKPVHKGIRMLSDSETEASPVKLDLSLADGTKKKVKFPANPDIDPMVLQDGEFWLRLNFR